MRLTFLGTAAATACPLPFCRCAACQAARETGGKDCRARSSLLINSDLLLDLGPDAPASALRLGEDLSRVRYLLQTHAHSDHFDAGHLVTRLAEYATAEDEIAPLTLCASRPAALALSDALGREEAGASLLDKNWQARLRLHFRAAEPEKELRLGQYTVLPLPSAHDLAGGSLLYAIWDGKTAVLYGTDSLFFDASIWAALRSFGHKLSCAVLDHTYGPDTPGGGHMNANQVAEVARLLRAHHMLAEGGVVLATHLSHEGNPSHAALSAWAAPRGYAVAYDGLRLEV